MVAEKIICNMGNTPTTAVREPLEAEFEIVETSDHEDGLQLPLVHQIWCRKGATMFVHQLFNELRRALFHGPKGHRVLVIGPPKLTNFFWDQKFLVRGNRNYCHVRGFSSVTGRYTVKGSLQQPGGKWPDGDDLVNTVVPGGLLILDQTQELGSATIEILQKRARSVLVLAAANADDKTISSFDTVYHIEMSPVLENPCLTDNPLNQFPLNHGGVFDDHFNH